MAVADDAAAADVCEQIRKETTCDNPRRFSDWVENNGHRMATGTICDQPIDLVLVPTRAAGHALLEEQDPGVDECVFIFSGDPLWSKKTTKSWGRRRFRMSTEQIRRKGGGAEDGFGFHWLVAVHGADAVYIRNVANAIAACYVRYFATRLALGMKPWGLTKGMREQPVVGNPEQILSVFGTPQDSSCTFPNLPISLQGIFCPNAKQDRTALVEDLAQEKVSAFIGVMEKILRLAGDGIRDVEFFALAPDLLDYPNLVPVLHPRTLANGRPEEHLARNWAAFTAVIQQLEQVTGRAIRLTSITSRVRSFIERAAEEARRVGIVDAIVDDFGKSVPSYTVLNVEETRRRVIANLILYLASARVAKEDRAALIGVEVSGKYWDRLWPYLKEQDIAPPIFWLPKFARQHFAFIE